MPERAHQVHVDVAETTRGYRYVLLWYLYVAVNLGLLAVQAGQRVLSICT
jgi:hypothetical protein